MQGTAGAGFITFPHQSSAPTTPGAGKALLHAFTNSGFTRLEVDNEATTNIILGRDSVVLAKNVTGSTMTAGQVVYVSGVTLGIPDVQLARANASTTLPALGVVMDSILTTAIGQVMIGGIAAFDTSAFSTGDQIYVSTTAAGGLQNTRPSGTSAKFVQRIGTVLTQGASGTVILAIAPFIGNLETGTTAATWTGNAVSATTYTGALQVTAVPANQAYSGITVILTYGESLVPGDIGYIKSDGSFWKADANAAGLYPAMGMAMETAASGSHIVLLNGVYRDDARYNWTVGGVLYLSTTAGNMTQTQPNATDDVIQVLGIATHADRVYFNPSPDYITHT